MKLRAHVGALPLGAILCVLGALTGLMVLLLHPERLPFTLCFFKAFTGWPCMTCGATRTLSRLLALDLPGALAMNPLVAVGALALVPWAAADLVLLPRGRALALELGPSGGPPRALQLASVGALLANWIYLVATGR